MHKQIDITRVSCARQPLAQLVQLSAFRFCFAACAARVCSLFDGQLKSTLIADSRRRRAHRQFASLSSLDVLGNLSLLLNWMMMMSVRNVLNCYSITYAASKQSIEREENDEEVCSCSFSAQLTRYLCRWGLAISSQFVIPFSCLVCNWINPHVAEKLWLLLFALILSF